MKPVEIVSYYCAKYVYLLLIQKNNKNIRMTTSFVFAQVLGRLFAPSQKSKKLSHHFRVCFELDFGILNAPRKIFWGVSGPIWELQRFEAVKFQGKNASQKWPQTSPKSILALHTMKKWTENSNMTFWYMPRSLDTNFLVVYEPCSALEGLRVVDFQGKNCFTKLVSNFSETDFGFS